MTPSELLKVNVNDHVEKKQNLSYLSWAWAWAEALKADPMASFQIQMFDGQPYLRINDTAMVMVTVIMFNKPITCFLPVMNGANKPITFEGRKIQTRNGEIIEKIDSFNVNTALMRCLTKGIAMHGLGLYIYAGEDLPEAEPVKVIPVDEGTGEVKGELQMDTGSINANAKLFADSMVKYSGLVKDLKDLNSYWKANQTQLDKLKAEHPELYDTVRTTFTNIKQKFSQPQE
jgi:hypothetical protein